MSLPKCPDAVNTWYSDVALCEANDRHLCLLEGGYECEYYEEYLEELEEDEDDDLPTIDLG